MTKGDYLNSVLRCVEFNSMRYPVKWLILIFLIVNIILSQTQKQNILIRCDDIGMFHSTNEALNEILLKCRKVPMSFSVMVVTPYYNEAFDILRFHPHISVGIHLTLTAEWKQIKWKPVCGSSVPSLTDSNGYFLSDRRSLLQKGINYDEVKRELRAQIKRGMESGVRIDYLDYHMYTAVTTIPLRKIVEELGKEYNLGLAGYFNDIEDLNIYNAPPKLKLEALLEAFNMNKSTGTKVIVIHPSQNSPEIKYLVYQHRLQEKYFANNRYAELKAITSEEFIKRTKQKNIELVDYRKLIRTIKIENMKRPPPPLTTME